jgi:hypothetical protein
METIDSGVITPIYKMYRVRLSSTHLVCYSSHLSHCISAKTLNWNSHGPCMSRTTRSTPAQLRHGWPALHVRTVRPRLRIYQVMYYISACTGQLRALKYYFALKSVYSCLFSFQHLSKPHRNLWISTWVIYSAVEMKYISLVMFLSTL